MSPSRCPACGTMRDDGLSPAIAGLGASGPEDEPACSACGHGLLFRVEPAGDVLIVHLKGRGIVTEQNVMRALERARHLIDGRDRGRVLLDFEGINYLSSTILGRLINLARPNEDGARIKLCNLRPDVRDVFRITRLEGFFEMHPSLDAAIGAF